MAYVEPGRVWLVILCGQKRGLDSNKYREYLLSDITRAMGYLSNCSQVLVPINVRLSRRRGYPRRPLTPPGIRFRTTAVHAVHLS
jgi:hypothetical protein